MVETNIESNDVMIDVSSVRDEAKRSLSMMGKRLETKDGNTLFTSSTLSSAEEKFLMTSLRKGTSVFLGEFARLITYSEYGETIQITFLTPLTNEDKKNAFRENFINFVVEYIQLKVFGLSLTDEARKNREEEMQAHLNAAKNLVFYVMRSPSVPKIPYTQHLSCRFEENATIYEGETFDLAYAIDDDVKDDIEAISSDERIASVEKNSLPNSFIVTPKKTGVVRIVLFSRHRDNVKVEIEFTVEKEEQHGI